MKSLILKNQNKNKINTKISHVLNLKTKIIKKNININHNKNLTIIMNYRCIPDFIFKLEIKNF